MPFESYHDDARGALEDAFARWYLVRSMSGGAIRKSIWGDALAMYIYVATGAPCFDGVELTGTDLATFCDAAAMIATGYYEEELQLAYGAIRSHWIQRSEYLALMNPPRDHIKKELERVENAFAGIKETANER